MAGLVDVMSDAELRTKLAEYGFPVMPITASTRGIMMKKLKFVMEGKGGGKNADSRRSLAKYSSGEDSDMDVSKTTKEKTKNRRVATGGAMLPPATSKLRKMTPKKSDSPAKIDNDKDSEPEAEPVQTHEEVKTVTTRRITRTFKPSQVEHEDYETGSDSDVDNKATSAGGYKSTYSATAAQPYTNLSNRSDYISSTLSPAAGSRDPVDSPLASYQSYSSTSDLNSIRSRLGLSQGYGDRPSVRSSFTPGYSSTYKPPTAGTEEIDSPYLSNFTRRLSSLKATSPRIGKDTDNTNGSGSYASKSLYKTSFKRRGDYSPDFKAAGEKNVFKTNLVSLAIVGVVLSFFICVFFVYLGMKGDVALKIEDKNNVIPICQSLAGYTPSENCVKKEHVSKATDLLTILYPELHGRAVAAGCGKSTEPIYMSESSVVQFVEKDYKNARKEQILEDLYNLHVLILNNPKWGISIMAVDTYQQDKCTPLTSMEYVLPKRKQGLSALAVLNPSIPWSCSLTHLLYYISLLAVALGSVGLVVFTVRKIISTYAEYKKKRKDQIYSIVEQIIDVLSQENEEGADPAGQSMAISHVRDMLIPPQNREKMADVWDEAIKFLEKNESRVRFEVERVAGEEYRAIRWVSPSGSPRGRTGARAWQGQAFETQEGSVNNLAVPPTPCLKIRHMVDKNDKNPNLKAVIRDAILEKCGPACRILHMEIDKASSCVYVKCASPADAGIVYHSLHGWWYEGNLITVKYLRLERYMDHFPDSPANGPYLKLSS